MGGGGGGGGGGGLEPLEPPPGYTPGPSYIQGDRCTQVSFKLPWKSINSIFMCNNHSVYVLLPISNSNAINMIKKRPLKWAGMVGAVGKISAFKPQGSQFDPRLCKI